MRISRTLAVATVCTLLAGCAASGRPPALPLPQDFTLELPQSGGRFILLQGEEVRIRLPANRDAGYRWSMVAETPGGETLKLTEEPVFETDRTAPNRGGSEIWHFRAEATGRAMVYFTYRGPQDKPAVPPRTATYSFEIR